MSAHRIRLGITPQRAAYRRVIRIAPIPQGEVWQAVLLFSTTELAIWWVAVTPLLIPAATDISLLQAEYYRRLAEEPTPPGETPPLPWRVPPGMGLFRASPDPLHERIRRRVIRTVPRFIAGAAVLWLVAINIAPLIALPRVGLMAVQAAYFGIFAVYGFFKFRLPGGRVTRQSKSVALVGLAFALATFIPIGPD
jgi:hypothetical protein